jgi:uncharacterized DUF497 family protein
LRWIWDEEKNRLNKRDHGISFETAQLVFDDPLLLSRPDVHPDEERWQTIGMIGPVVVFVVHTAPQPETESDEDPDAKEAFGRIISARKATSHERRAYEEGEY